MKTIDKKNKYTAQFCLSAFLVVSGIILLFVGLFLPPIGDINWSVLTAYGEVSTFAGSIIGVDYSYRIKELQHRDGAKEREGAGGK